MEGSPVVGDGVGIKEGANVATVSEGVGPGVDSLSDGDGVSRGVGKDVGIGVCRVGPGVGRTNFGGQFDESSPMLNV